MAEDADYVDETGTDDEQSELEEDVPEESVTVEKEERKVSLPSNPLGLILNLRMLRRFVQFVFFIGINGYILLAWFRMPNVQAFWLSIWNNLPTIPILALRGSLCGYSRVL